MILLFHFTYNSELGGLVWGGHAGIVAGFYFLPFFMSALLIAESILQLITSFTHSMLAVLLY